MITLDQLLDQVGQHAHHTLIEENNDSLVPLYHLITKQNESIIIACPWATTDQKLLAIQAIKQLAHKKNAVLAAFVSECWMVVKDAPLTPWHARQMINEPPPSEDPKRIETILAVATDGESTKAKMWQMVRARPGGTLIALMPHPVNEGQFAGRMIDGIIKRK